MSKRNWRRYLAIGGIAATLFSSSALGQQPPRPLTKPANQPEQKAPEPKPFAVTIPDGVEIKESSVSEERREAGEQRDKDDLEAQQWMARATVAQTIIGLLSLAGLGLTVWFARKAWKAAEASAKAGREANEGFASTSYRELRAYVSLTGIKGFVVPREDHSTIPTRHYLSFVISVGLMNTGRTPAKSVVRVMEVWPLSGSTITTAPPGLLGFSGNRKRLDIGPDQPFVHRYEFESQYQPSWLTSRHGHSYAGQPGIEIKGTIEYTDFDDNRWRIPYTCTSAPFSTSFNPSSFEPLEIEFGELEQAEEEQA